MSDKFSIKDGELSFYTGYEQNVIIPNGVEKIGLGVFAGHDEIKSVTIGNGVLIKYCGNEKIGA